MADILIVDDSSVVRQGLKKIVESLGHRVVGEAPSGSQAFVEYKQCKPDLVTMDLTMEGMSGAEATSKIVAVYPDARIIVISAIEERSIILDALERGARHFIVKPITKEKVADVMQSVLQQDFDSRKHMEMVKRLRGTMDNLGGSKAYIPPYQISTQDGKLVMVRIGASLTLTSCNSLQIELEEYLTGSPRILFDFGEYSSCNEQILMEISKLIEYIESKSGLVRAASRNQQFVTAVGAMDPAPGFLAAVLQYIGG